MITLSKTQKNMLKATLDSGSDNLQMPDNIYGNALDAVISRLLEKGLIEKRHDNYIITDIGRLAIKDPSANETPANNMSMTCNTPRTEVPQEPLNTTKKPREGTKQAILVGLLKRPQGTTISEMVEATLWQKHTVRGTLSHTIKKRLGYVIESVKNADNIRVYRIIEA